MPKRSDRIRKKRMVRTVSGKAKTIFKDAKARKARCALCEKVMHGMPHGRKVSKLGKMSRTEKRPEALFAGTLCNKCRLEALEEAIKVKVGIKKSSELDMEARKYVKELLPKIEV